MIYASSSRFHQDICRKGLKVALYAQRYKG